LQKELAETKAQRLEVEASAQELAATLDSDLERRRAELEDALSAADAGVTKCDLHTPAAPQCSAPHCVAQQVRQIVRLSATAGSMLLDDCVLCARSYAAACLRLMCRRF
jgi:hypothetical protein